MSLASLCSLSPDVPAVAGGVNISERGITSCEGGRWDGTGQDTAKNRGTHSDRARLIRMLRSEFGTGQDTGKKPGSEQYSLKRVEVGTGQKERENLGHSLLRAVRERRERLGQVRTTLTWGRKYFFIKLDHPKDNRTLIECGCC